MASPKIDALYARFSSNNQQDGTSVEYQIERCEQTAGHALRHYIDRARSGTTIAGREALSQLICDAESGIIGKLHVYKFDRLSRSERDSFTLIDHLEECGVTVISCTEGSSTNRLAMGVQMIVAADYSRALAHRTLEGLRQRFKAGCHIGGPANFGYRITTDAEGKKRLAINPQEAESIRFLVKTYLAESIGLKELARRLEARGVATRTGVPWSFTTIRSILTNSIITGRVQYLRRKFKRQQATGRRIPKFSDSSRHLTRQDETLRIIDDESFAKVQEKLAASGGTRKPRSSDVIRPFTRHLYCGTCGSVFHSRKSKNSKGCYHYYGCGRRQSHGPEGCTNAIYLREDHLKDRVMLALTKMFADAEGMMAEALEIAQARVGVDRADGARLKEQMATAEKEVANLVRLLADPEIEPMAKRAVSRQVGEAEGRLDQLRKALEAVGDRAHENTEDLVAACREAFREARDMFGQVSTPAEFNRLVEVVVGPVVVLPDGRMAQKQETPSGCKPLGVLGIAGGCYARHPQTYQLARECLRGVFWATYGKAA